MIGNDTTKPDDQRFKIDDAESYNAVVDYFDLYTERFSSHMSGPLLAMANIPANGKVLDVGTGSGIIALEIAAKLGQQVKVVGIDLSDGMLAAASGKAALRGLKDQTEFLKMDAENLGFPDKKFDAAISLYALRHFPHPEKSLTEIFRVLKPGASIVVAVGSPPALLSVDGAVAVFRRLGSILRKTTGRELQACNFIDGLVEKYIPEKKDRDVTEWADHHHCLSGPIKRFVQTAGFNNIRTGWIGQYSTIDSVDDFWCLQKTFSSIARKRIQQANQAEVDRLKEEFYRHCEQVLQKKGRLVYQTGAAIVAAVKPF